MREVLSLYPSPPSPAAAAAASEGRGVETRLPADHTELTCQYNNLAEIMWTGWATPSTNRDCYSWLCISAEEVRHECCNVVQLLWHSGHMLCINCKTHVVPPLYWGKKLKLRHVSFVKWAFSSESRLVLGMILSRDKSSHVTTSAFCLSNARSLQSTVLT